MAVTYGTFCPICSCGVCKTEEGEQIIIVYMKLGCHDVLQCGCKVWWVQGWICWWPDFRYSGVARQLCGPSQAGRGIYYLPMQAVIHAPLNQYPGQPPISQTSVHNTIHVYRWQAKTRWSRWREKGRREGGAGALRGRGLVSYCPQASTAVRMHNLNRAIASRQHNHYLGMEC